MDDLTLVYYALGSMSVGFVISLGICYWLHRSMNDEKYKQLELPFDEDILE